MAGHLVGKGSKWQTLQTVLNAREIASVINEELKLDLAVEGIIAYLFTSIHLFIYFNQSFRCCTVASAPSQHNYGKVSG